MKEKKVKKIRPWRGVTVWGIVTALVLVVAIVANILVTGMFSSLMDVVFGGKRPIYDNSVESMYVTDVTSKDEAYANAQKLNLRLAEEGFVLLKNQENALPLNKNAKISVFGKNSVNLSYGGSGSGGFDTSGNRDLYASLEDAGFQTNPTLKEFYNNNSASGAARAANSSDLIPAVIR